MKVGTGAAEFDLECGLLGTGADTLTESASVLLLRTAFDSFNSNWIWVFKVGSLRNIEVCMYENMYVLSSYMIRLYSSILGEI